MPTDDPHRFALRLTAPRDARVGALARRHARVGLDGVLADLDRTAVPCEVPGAAAVDGFRWDDHDLHDPGWYPQGVAHVQDREVLLVSWYARRRLPLSGGSRVSVVDLQDPDRPRYRHVRLVAPRPAGALGAGGVRVHAGGIAVVGGLLYVADTVAGVRVFRLADAVRRAGRYELPQLLRLRVPLRSGLRFSFLTVADVAGEASLVVGEYRRQDGGPPRLVRYLLDRATGLPRTDHGGRCVPVDVHTDQPPRMQGVAVVDGTWFLTASTGEGRPGDLHVGRPGAFVRHRGVLPPGPEDLDLAPDGVRLWCASEWPGRRWVFRVDAARWRSAPG